MPAGRQFRAQRAAVNSKTSRYTRKRSKPVTKRTKEVEDQRAWNEARLIETGKKRRRFKDIENNVRRASGLPPL